jgi:hypothetical protein
MRLLYVFPLATAVVVAAVWALGEIDAWWVLVPTFLVYVLATGVVMRTLAQTLALGEDADDQPEAPAMPRAPRPAARRPVHSGRLLPH